MLGEAGYTCVASTDESRPEVCALHRKNRYDLILLDLQMPGMDGFQVMEGLKTNADDGYLPVLVLTAQPGHKLRALQAGARDFISKPFDLTEVKTRIHNMLEVRLLYKALGNYSKELEETVLERTAQLRESEARYRSLAELASDWYWEQDEHGAFTKVSGPVLEMLGIRVEPLVGEASGAPVAGWNEAEREVLRATIADRQPFLDFPLQPRERRWLAPVLSRERRADVQPVVRFIGYRGIGVELSRRSSAAITPPRWHLHSPNQNHLLSALPTAEFARLSPHLELVALPLGETLFEPGGQLQHAYFPTTAIVSLHYVMESGASSESAGVGNEGVVGISLFMGGTPRRARRWSSPRAMPTGCRAGPDGGIRPRGPAAAPVAALHPGPDHADDADRGLQSAPFGGAAAVPLAPVDPRQDPLGRARHDAGAGRQHARRARGKASRRRPGRCRTPDSSAIAGATSRCSIARGWKRVRASATRS
jgi:CheY-like chemotaxis protein